MFNVIYFHHSKKIVFDYSKVLNVLNLSVFKNIKSKFQFQINVKIRRNVQTDNTVPDLGLRGEQKHSDQPGSWEGQPTYRLID